ncbi:hypothetical protein HQ533_00130 [Candidatus Woesearchaeota archaeon]|nr:hypothetical protein [Candidatus Woesearchaeota archaeon]
MTAGRPIKSEIRQNIVDILHFMGKGYGYQIHKEYLELFPKVTQRVVYYHLKKGVSIGEFVIKKISKEKGDYSWGETAEKIYYALGKDASPRALAKIKKYFEKKKSKR